MNISHKTTLSVRGADVAGDLELNSRGFREAVAKKQRIYLKELKASFILSSLLGLENS